ncbi:maleylpyruvate isomerase family mycothiol-dependent enzyme [Nocardia sp. NPDC052112]|uniref:maleylpyruvate isomerase family mycothiol-dependent enzyme n=1 Tax=Nocardia sp. NPDC052112 TaxID=3155646 RepID=UPI00342F332A
MLNFARLCAEIPRQTGTLAALIEDVDPTLAVPDCPGWNLGQLLRHIGGYHRWMETIVRTRAAEPVSDAQFNDLSGHFRDPSAIVPWLIEGATRLAQTLSAAGPETTVWTPGPGGTTVFWARRALHEAVVHGWDAAAAARAELDVSEDIMADGFEEWLEVAASPEAYEPQAGQPGLLGAGRLLSFHAPNHNWVVDLTGPAPIWRSADEPAAVTVRSALADLLRFVYHRPALDTLEISGDRALLDLWRARTGFWLTEDGA